MICEMSTYGICRTDKTVVLDKVVKTHNWTAMMTVYKAGVPDAGISVKMEITKRLQYQCVQCGTRRCRFYTSNTQQR